MSFKTLFLAHAPDADKDKHRCFIDTGKYQLDVVIVKNQAEALEVSVRPSCFVQDSATKTSLRSSAPLKIRFLYA